jgi:DNA-binding transcriptional MerR regulator
VGQHGSDNDPQRDRLTIASSEIPHTVEPPEFDEQLLPGMEGIVPAPPTGRQGMLFDDDLVALDENIGYRGPIACKAAGITYRQLDYWARTKLVEPTVRGAKGSGTQRLYSFRDVLVLKIVKRLLDTGVSLQQIRSSVEHLRTRGVEDLAQITLMSDGASVYECTSPDEVIDLVQAGQGVFGIAVGRVWRELETNLSTMPGEDMRGPLAEEGKDFPGDELSARRAARNNAAG